MKMLFASACFALLTPSNAFAFTGSDLLVACNDGAAAWDEGSCFGFLLGFVKGLEFAGIHTTAHFSGWEGYEATSSEAENILSICLPDGVSGEQVRLVALKFLNEHPERLHEAAHFLLADALKGAFPCR